MLTVPWQGFVAINIALYTAANALFACVYLLGGYLLGEENTILNARPGSFSDAFFFSVQTSASIGYGVMSPGTTFGHLVVTLEAILSLTCIAVLTGLTAATKF
jgi:inward rectifier potassium channel